MTAPPPPSDLEAFGRRGRSGPPVTLLLASFLASTIIGNPVPGVILGDPGRLVLQRSLRLNAATALPCGGGETALRVEPTQDRFVVGLPALPTDTELCGIRLEGLSLHLVLAQDGGFVGVDLWVPRLELSLSPVQVAPWALPRLLLDLGAEDWLVVPVGGVQVGEPAHDALVAELIASARFITP
jgi:hypothetical protein